MRKYLEECDEKFVKAGTTSEGRAELIRKMSRTRLLSMIAVACLGAAALLAALTKTPPDAWLYFAFLFLTILMLNADQQIKMLKCLGVNEESGQA